MIDWSIKKKEKDKAGMGGNRPWGPLGVGEGLLQQLSSSIRPSRLSLSVIIFSQFLPLLVGIRRKENESFKWKEKSGEQVPHLTSSQKKTWVTNWLDEVFPDLIFKETQKMHPYERDSRNPGYRPRKY